jgi:hypothetical protein
MWLRTLGSDATKESDTPVPLERSLEEYLLLAQTAESLGRVIGDVGRGLGRIKGVVVPDSATYLALGRVVDGSAQRVLDIHRILGSLGRQQASKGTVFELTFFPNQLVPISLIRPDGLREEGSIQAASVWGGGVSLPHPCIEFDDSSGHATVTGSEIGLMEEGPVEGALARIALFGHSGESGTLVVPVTGRSDTRLRQVPLE